MDIKKHFKLYHYSKIKQLICNWICGKNMLFCLSSFLFFSHIVLRPWGLLPLLVHSVDIDNLTSLTKHFNLCHYSNIYKVLINLYSCLLSLPLFSFQWAWIHHYIANQQRKQRVPYRVTAKSQHGQSMVNAPKLAIILIYQMKWDTRLETGKSYGYQRMQDCRVHPCLSRSHVKCRIYRFVLVTNGILR